ncbi:MAG TPA: VWA domain-containing protein, partial [Chloroflexia bacterium]|nr:VWA domain-containing protein [Chloroflexia bacterium]
MDALGARLAGRWLAFERLLRRNGVPTTAGQMQSWLQVLAAGLVDSADRATVYYAARALLCNRHEDWPRYDLIFRQFWGRTRQIIIPSDTAAPRPETEGPGGPPARPVPPSRDDAPDVGGGVERLLATDAPDLPGEEAGDGRLPERVLLYSAYERLRQRDFGEFTAEELRQAHALLAGWRWQPAWRRTRRLTRARRGRRLDIGRTLRAAMRHGGVPLGLAWRGPDTRPRPLVLLCDISGSMAPYTRVLLHFLYILNRGLRHAEVFVFATRLTRITRALRARTVDLALAEVGHSVVDWSGGTRIGAALRAFNTGWARRVLGQGAVVCMISDGWDRGTPAQLAAELAHLQRTAFRLIWLNPL